MAARKTKLPPRLTAVKGIRQHWGQRLNTFRVKHGLSERDLVEVINSALRKSAIHDLMSGECSPRLEKVIKPVIATNLRQFLKKRKMKALEIEREMLEIFHEPICTKEIEPVLTQRAILTKAAQTHFGLRQDPFTVDPRNRNEVFSTAQLDKIAGLLEDTINFQGFRCVIGDVGAGKSLLKRRVNQTCIDSKGKMIILWPEFFNMEKVHSGSIAAYILRHFGKSSPHDLVQRAGRLKELLASMADEGIRVALGFDECHRLDPRLLTALKNFWELGSGGYDRYLGLILFGQPRFESVLRDVKFREIAERLDIIRMPNLGKHAWDYVALRLKTAGGNAEKLFDRAAVTKLAEISSTPLALGNLCNAALMKAFEFGQKKVPADLFKDKRFTRSDDPGLRGLSKAS